METLRRLAVVVDAQNASDSKYTPMAPSYNSPEWNAAIDLVFCGRNAPNGYTETSLLHWRQVRKAADALPLPRKRSTAAAPSEEEAYRRGNSMGGAM